MHSTAKALLLASVLFPGLAAAATVTEPEAAFARLSSLVGTWEGRFEDGRLHGVAYRLTAAGTVLVETWTLGSGRESLTLYHRDGDRLLADHYCPQGNQPRLQLTEIGAGGRLSFAFLSGSNLQVDGKSHQHSFWIEIEDPGSFQRGETYVENGSPASELAKAGPGAAIRYTRVPNGGAVTEDLSPFFGGLEGTFVVLDTRTRRTLRHAPERARTRFLPASTFKIPNTLIALETGVANGPDFPLAWNATAAPRQPWWPAIWAQDHTLASALRGSVVWYYQELARRIGPERMQSHLDRFGYGNRDLGGGIDRFWLTGDLRISADEQVEFLRRFHAGELGISERTTRIVKDLLVLEEGPGYRLSGKTGWAGLGTAGTAGTAGSAQIGWLVGYVERDGAPIFFAMNIDIAKSEDTAARMSITKSILRHLGHLPAS